MLVDALDLTELGFEGAAPEATGSAILPRFCCRKISFRPILNNMPSCVLHSWRAIRWVLWCDTWVLSGGRSVPFSVLTQVAFHSAFVMSKAGSQIAM